MTPLDDFWKWADTSLGSNIVGGLTVAALIGAIGVVASLTKRSWRNRIWGTVARFVEWLATVRLTTTTRIRTHEAEIQQARLALEEALASAAESREAMPEAPDVADGLGRMNGSRSDVQVNSRWLIADGQAPESPLPLPKPRWSIYVRPDSADGKDYFISNAMPRSVAREVRLDSQEDCFTFHDAAHWESMSGTDTSTFRGEVKKGFERARQRGFQMYVEWFDETGNKCKTEVRIAASESAPPRTNVGGLQPW